MHSRTMQFFALDQSRWLRMKVRRVMTFVMTGVVIFTLVYVTQAAEVTCSDVPCLVSAMQDAQSGEPTTIRLAPGTYSLMQPYDDGNGPTGLPFVTGSLILEGMDARTTIIRREPDAPTFRLLRVEPTGTLTLRGLTLQGGVVFDPDGGGGLWNRGGVVTIQDTIITDNSAVDLVGGGIWNSYGDDYGGGRMTIERSTIQRNHAEVGLGAGLANDAFSTLTVRQSAIIGNVAFDGVGAGLTNLGVAHVETSTIGENTTDIRLGGGVANFGEGDLTLLSVTVAGNIAGEASAIFVESGSVMTTQSIITGTCSGMITSAGYTLVADPSGCPIVGDPTDVSGDPQLSSLMDDGIAGHGHFSLTKKSPAINTGDKAVCPEVDQLGQRRRGRCDIGAVEFRPGKALK